MSRPRDPALARLEADLHRLVPISAAMGVRVLRLEPAALELAAPLARNHNHAGTGFAGSLYALATLSGWAYLRYLIDAAGLEALLLLGEAGVRYHHPCRDELHSHTGLGDAERGDRPAVTVQGRFFALPGPAEASA